MSPIIYVRTARPSANALDILPTIKLTDFFTQSTENDAVVFDMTKANISKEEFDALEIRDEESKKFYHDLTNMTPQEDSQLIEQLSEIATKAKK